MRTTDKNRVNALKEYIRCFRIDYDRFPTFREMLNGCEYVSRQTLQADIRRLIDEGFLVAGEHGRISFSDAADGIKGNAISVVGSVRCGSPTEAQEEVEGCVILPTSIFGTDKNLVLLRAKGYSMKDRQISDGELPVVRKQPVAEAGNIVIACLCDGEATCKTLKRDEDGFYYLHPENPDYCDIVPCEGWYIYGVVRQVIHSI